MMMMMMMLISTDCGTPHSTYQDLGSFDTSMVQSLRIKKNAKPTLALINLAPSMSLLAFNSTCRAGPDKWRDIRKPRTILKDWCLMHNKPLPEYNDEPCSVMLDGTVYTLSQFGKYKALYETK